jgi:hypothetical protein
MIQVVNLSDSHRVERMRDGSCRIPAEWASDRSLGAGVRSACGAAAAEQVDGEARSV